MPRRTHVLPIAFLMLLLALLTTERAEAQGTFGALPDPISSQHLNGYADRLGMSDQQLLALGEPHARYLEQFRQLREGDIEKFFDHFREMRPGRFDPSQFKQFETIVKDFTRLMNRIRTLDESFFNDMQGVLTDDQAEKLIRIRQSRERERLRTEASRVTDFVNPAVRVDLAEMLLELDLPPADLEAVDPLLASYEHQLTTYSRRVFDSGTKAILDGLKKLDKLGLDQEMMENPGRMMRFFGDFQLIWDEIKVDLLKSADQLAELNQRTFRQLATALPNESYRQLRAQYLGRAYREAAEVGRQAESLFRGALEMEELPSEMRESVAALAAAHLNSQDRLADQIMDLLNEHRRNLTLMQIARMGEDPVRAKIDELQARAQAADESAIETLKAMLGPGLAEELSPAPPGVRRREDRIAVRTERGRGGVGARMVVARGGGMHQGAISFLTGFTPPDRISEQAVDQLAQRLALDEMQLALLHSLHDDYLDRFNSIRNEHAAPYARVVEQIRREEDRPSDPAELAELLDSGFQRLLSLLEAVRAADQRFFDDVQIALLDGSDEGQLSVLKAAVSSRDRIQYQVPEQAEPTGPAMAFIGSAGEARVDIAELVTSLNVERTLWSDIAPLIAAYEQDAADLFRQRFESEVATHRQSLQFMMARRGDDDRERRGNRFREMGERMTQVREAARTVNNALAELNRKSLDVVLDRLPEHEGTRLEDAYYRKAFPAAFDDPASAEERIQSALTLRDLTEAQRSRLMEIAAEYRPVYRDITYAIVEHHMALADAPVWRGPRRDRERGGERENAMRERMERASSLEVLNFDRAELNERTMRELRAILRPDQVEQIAAATRLDASTR